MQHLENREYYLIDMTTARRGIQLGRFVGGYEYNLNSAAIPFEFFNIPHTFPTLPEFEITNEYYRHNPSSSELFGAGIQELDRIYEPSNSNTFIRSDQIDDIENVDLYTMFEELNSKIFRMEPGKRYKVIAKTKFNQYLQGSTVCLSKISFVSRLVRSEPYFSGTDIEMFFENGYHIETTKDIISVEEEVDLYKIFKPYSKGTKTTKESGVPQSIIGQIQEYYFGGKRKGSKRKGSKRKKTKSRKPKSRSSR